MDKVASQTEVQKGKRKTKTVNQEVVKRKISELPREALTRKIRAIKKQIVRESAEVVVCEKPLTKGPNVYIVRITISNV